MFYDNYVRMCNMVGKSPSAVAVEIGIQKSTVTRWSKGSMPNHATALKVADYFGVEEEYFLKPEMYGGPGRRVHPIPMQCAIAIDEEKIEERLKRRNKKAPTDEAMSAKKEPAGFDESSITKRELLNLVSDLSETEAALFLELLKNALGKS